jgi:hypothetical protein
MKLTCSFNSPCFFETCLYLCIAAAILPARFRYIIREISSVNMSGPGVGFEYPRTEVSWLKRDVLLFAVSIGATAKEELHFIYVREDI